MNNAGLLDVLMVWTDNRDIDPKHYSGLSSPLEFLELTFQPTSPDARTYFLDGEWEGDYESAARRLDWHESPQLRLETGEYGRQLWLLHQSSDDGQHLVSAFNHMEEMVSTVVGMLIKQYRSNLVTLHARNLKNGSREWWLTFGESRIDLSL